MNCDIFTIFSTYVDISMFTCLNLATGSYNLFVIFINTVVYLAYSVLSVLAILYHV